MAENVIDTLKLDIIVNTKQNGQSITTLRNSLEKLYKFLNGVNSQDFSKVSNDIAKIGGRLTPLVNAINSLDGQGLKNLTSLGTRLQTLNKRMGEIDAKAMAHKFDQMTQAITPFIDKVMSAQEALVALNNVMGGAKTLTKTATPKATTTTTPKATTNTNILGGKLGKSLNFGSMVAKLYFVRNITKQLGQDLAKVVQYGIDYEETLNLWQTAMRGNISQARVFTNEMTRAYGISSATLMNYQATFKNMLSALGNISEGTAYGLSEALTQMALDFSSLYNVSVESAMTKFQAVLSGQVRPIRTAGYDITEQTLFQLYQSIGGTKTVRQLNQTEKQLLRILAVYKQMERSGATGDLSKTMWTSTANQIRMAKEQLKEFATWIGVGLNAMLEQSKILITINAYLYAGVALAKEFADYVGYVEKDYGISWSDDIKDAEDEYEKFKGKLLGFDKFQVLASAGTDNADVEQVLLDSIKAYQGLLDNAENPAFQKSLDILKAIGLELDENGNIVGGAENIFQSFDRISKVIEEIKPKYKELFSSLGSLLLSFAPVAEELVVLFLDIYNILLPIAKDILVSLSPAVKPLTEIIKDIAFYTKNWLEFLAPVLKIFAGVLEILTPVLEILRLISGVVSMAVTVVFSWATAGGAVFLVFEAIAKVLRTIGELVRALFQWDWASLGENLKKIWSDWEFGDSMKVRDRLKENNFLPSNFFFANGGLATKGSLFYAGEAGPELVTQTSGGNSTIMNMRQLEDAVAKGMFRAMVGTRTEEGEQVINVGVDGQNLFTIFRGVARRNGYDLVKVN